jgi:hypothetical protein
MTTDEADDEYRRLLRFLKYTLHELPAGVLYDTDGADEKSCAELMRYTYRLEELAKDRSIDHSRFIARCRWHYERYPHYLRRQRHFGSYANYMARHHAPENDDPA